ncbi:MAG: glycosyltransferase family 4 protein, partial [Salinivirgaceae bacterium]|nr:glycosyltransferase family 4 protein [Salinivirgaceae bacterium]
MNVLYLHQYFATPESNAGTRSYEMAKRLAAKGHEVTFVTTSAYLSNNYVLKAGWNEMEIDGIRLYVLHLSYSNKDSFIKRIFKFLQFSWLSTLKSLSIKSDVVFATSTPLTIAIPGLIYSKIKKTPLVFEIRDLWPELPVAVGAIKNPFVIKLAEWLEKYTYKNSARLIGLSPGMCDGIIRHGIAKDKVTLATNSCDTELFDVEKSLGESYKETNLGFLKGRKLVVYTGTFGLINNVGYLPELAKSMKEIDSKVCFVAIGDGMEKQTVIDKAAELNVLDKNLYILPPVPKTEIVKLLSAADMSISLFGPIPEMWH